MLQTLFPAQPAREYVSIFLANLHRYLRSDGIYLAWSFIPLS